MTASVEANAPPVITRQQWLTLAVVLIGTFMVLLDVGIVNVAIPTIQRTLGATTSQIQLIVAAYQLSYAALLITGGRLGDLYGRKRMFMLGLAGFALTSALCGFATSAWFLVAARGLQGLTAAMLYPQVASVIQVTFAPHERATAFGLFGATIGLGTITGPLLGGVLVAADIGGLSWRPIFLINLPVALVGIIAAQRVLTETRGATTQRLDLVGVGLVSVGLVLLTVPVVEGSEAGWPWWTWAVLALGALVIGLFVRYERQLMARGGAPLLDLTLFNDAAYRVGLLLNGVFFLGIFSFFLYTAMYLQIGLGFTPLRSAGTLVPFQITAFVVALLSARVARRLGRGVLSVATALMTTGMALIAVIIGWRGAGLAGWELAGPLMLCGAGFGLFGGPAQAIIMASVPVRNAGAAAGLLATIGQLAAAFGVAIVGALLVGVLGGSPTLAAAPAFAAALSGTLRFHVLVYALAFGLVLLLPRRTAVAGVVPAE